jgi:hypothetical protein
VGGIVATRTKTARAGSAQAAAVIWRWRDGEPDAVAQPSATSARLRGSLQASAAAAVGLASYLYFSKSIALLAFAMAALVLLAVLVSPHGLYALLQRLFEATGRVIGRAMTWIVMLPIFYLFFLPFGKLMRRGKRDRLRRYYEPAATTYWEPHVAMKSSSRERQY